jgi:hypothetical protein
MKNKFTLQRLGQDFSRGVDSINPDDLAAGVNFSRGWGVVVDSINSDDFAARVNFLTLIVVIQPKSQL